MTWFANNILWIFMPTVAVIVGLNIAVLILRAKDGRGGAT